MVTVGILVTRTLVALLTPPLVAPATMAPRHLGLLWVSSTYQKHNISLYLLSLLTTSISGCLPQDIEKIEKEIQASVIVVDKILRNGNSFQEI